MRMKRILFVCLGNICRSPMAEGVFLKVASERGLAPPLEVDSAGTGSWHIGDPPDSRARQAAAARGVDISAQRARQVQVPDFDDFDLIAAMDRSNVTGLESLAPPHQRLKIRLFLEFAPQAGALEVPDPYYDGAAGFNHALDLIEAASHGLAEYIAGKASS
jgi:protein-tyrosine phosphatase